MSNRHDDFVLRPFLYSRLCALLGNVRVTNAGQPCQAHLVTSPLARSGRRLELESWGENYVVDCPVCGDSRQRLYVGHLWGHFDERTGTRNWWMIKCFNEDCFSEYARRMELASRIFDTLRGLVGPYGDLSDRLRPARVVSEHRTACMPGPVILVDNLVGSHPARLYLESRGFDCSELTELYRVGYCAEPHRRFPLAANRLVLPVYQDDELVGWQARLPYDQPPNGQPKYYSMPGFKKSRALYNLDRARGHDHVVLVEGPTDVWRYGPEAVASFGKSVSLSQLELLRQYFDRIVVLLDADARHEARRVFERLSPHVGRVWLVHLREGSDPGSLPRNALRRSVARAMAKDDPVVEPGS